MGRKIALVPAIIVCMGAAVEFAQAIPACSGDACNSFQIKLISRDKDSLRFSVINIDKKRAIQFVGCVTDLKAGQAVCGWQFEGVIEAGQKKDFNGPLTKDPNIAEAMKFAIFRNDNDKAQIEQLEKERAALLNCKDVKVNNLAAPLCCATNKDTGCVRNAEDCKLLGGTEKTSVAPACNKGFPGYAGQVAKPANDCSIVKVDADWTAAKGFKKLKNGQCEIIYDCVLKSAVPPPFSIVCEPAFPVSQARTGTCTDAKCTDCKATPPGTKCTVRYVQKK
jgi:hypothetical protein